MRALLGLSRQIDSLSSLVGRATSWLATLMIGIGAANAILRYLSRDLGLNIGGNAALEAQWYLFSLMFLLGAAWTLERNAHVRVDVLYGRLSPKKRAVIDLAGSVLFLLPFCAFALYVSGPTVWNSWEVREMSQDPGGLPRYPIKAVILVSFLLLAIQGVSEVIKSVARLRGHLPLVEGTEAKSAAPAAKSRAGTNG
jgi:TRAP-type mannitol/chloroaromatic compound transport system permease small subunit